MDTEEFIVHIVRQSRKIYPIIRDWDWLLYQRLADLTKYIDYNCGFGEDGLCGLERERAERRSSYDKDRDLQKCCCSGCCSSIGHKKTFPNDYKTLKEYAVRFEAKQDGFWRRGVGCTLPRKYRSSVCLRHVCRAKGAASPVARTLLDLLRQKPKKSIRINERTCHSDNSLINHLEKQLKEEAKTWTEQLKR